MAEQMAKHTTMDTEGGYKSNPAPSNKEMKYFVDTHTVRYKIMERFGAESDLQNPPSTAFVEETVQEFANRHGGKIAESQLSELWDWILSLCATQVATTKSTQLQHLVDAPSPVAEPGLAIPDIFRKSTMTTKPAVAIFSQSSSFEPESHGATLDSDLLKLSELDAMGKIMRHGVPASQSGRIGKHIAHGLLGNPNDALHRNYNASARFHDRNIETAKADNEYLWNMLLTVDDKVGGNFIQQSWALQHLHPRLTKSDRIMVKSIKESHQTIAGLGADGSFEKVQIHKKSFHMFHLGSIGAYVQSCLRALCHDLVAPWYQDVQHQFEVYTRKWFETALFNCNFGVVSQLSDDERSQAQGDLESAVSTTNFKGLLGMFKKIDGNFKACVATEIDGKGYTYKHWDKFLWTLKLQDGAMFCTNSSAGRLFFAHHKVYTFLCDICNAQQISTEHLSGVTSLLHDSVLRMPNGDKVICQNHDAAYVPADYMVSVPPKALFFLLNMENPYFYEKKGRRERKFQNLPIF